MVEFEYFKTGDWLNLKKEILSLSYQNIQAFVVKYMMIPFFERDKDFLNEDSLQTARSTGSKWAVDNKMKLRALPNY